MAAMGLGITVKYADCLYWHADSDTARESQSEQSNPRATSAKPRRTREVWFSRCYLEPCGCSHYECDHRCDQLHRLERFSGAGEVQKVSHNLFLCFDRCFCGARTWDSLDFEQGCREHPLDAGCYGVVWSRAARFIRPEDLAFNHVQSRSV